MDWFCTIQSLGRQALISKGVSGICALSGILSGARIPASGQLFIAEALGFASNSFGGSGGGGEMNTRGIRAMLLCAAIVAAWALPAHAQAIGSIFGKVTDPSGAVLPGVTVTVTGPSLQQPLVAVTSESGTYQFPSVPVGTFTVTFELPSFKKAVRPNVVISSGFNAGGDQKLDVGQMTEEVTISAASPVVDTKKASTSATFTADVLEK